MSKTSTYVSSKCQTSFAACALLETADDMAEAFRVKNVSKFPQYSIKFLSLHDSLIASLTGSAALNIGAHSSSKHCSLNSAVGEGRRPSSPIDYSLTGTVASRKKGCRTRNTAALHSGPGTPHQSPVRTSHLTPLHTPIHTPLHTPHPSPVHTAEQTLTPPPCYSLPRLPVPQLWGPRLPSRKGSQVLVRSPVERNHKKA